MADHFPFRFDPRYARFLAPFGITPGKCEVVVTDDDLRVRFGFWRLRTPLSNISDASVAGPHRPVRAIGMRMSLQDRGLTFGTTAERTTCIEFHRPVPGIEPLGVIRHPNLSVSVVDPQVLAARLRTASS